MGKKIGKFILMLSVIICFFSSTIIQTVHAEGLNESEIQKKIEATAVAAEEKDELKVEVTPEPKEEVVEEPKVEATPETKKEIVEEPKVEATPETKKEVVEEPKVEATPETKKEVVEEPKVEATPEPKEKEKKAKTQIASIADEQTTTAKNTATIEPALTKDFDVSFIDLNGNAVTYEVGVKINNTILVDITTDQDFTLKTIINDHPVYTDYAAYSVSLIGIPETSVNFGDPFALQFKAGSSYKYNANAMAENYRIVIYAIDLSGPRDTGVIMVNKQRNTADITIDKKENPSSITFKNEGNSDKQTKEWTVVDQNGKVVSTGTGDSVPKSELEKLPEGNYTVNLTTKGDSQFGNAVEEKEDTDTFKIVYGDLKVTHTIIDENGNKTIVETTDSRGRVGSEYSTEPMDIPGYRLVEKPANADGEYTEEGVLVEYYYEIIQPELTVKYVDEKGNELHPPVKSTGVYGDSYSTEKKTFEGYELVAIPANASGTFGEDDITVIYVYRLIDDGGDKEDPNANDDNSNANGGDNDKEDTNANDDNSNTNGGDNDKEDTNANDDNNNTNGGDNDKGNTNANDGNAGQDKDPSNTDYKNNDNALTKFGALGKLPQMGSRDMITTGVAGGIVALIGALILVLRRKY